MLKKIFVWILAAMLAFSNVGCTSVPQPTMEELLEEVNAEHAAVEQADDFSQYLRKPLGETTFKIMQTFPFSDEEFDPQKVLTLEQATEDVDYLFTVFHDTYPLYDYFGGEEAFTAAREKILADCAAAQPLTGEVLVESMIAHLNFVEDRHFSINKQTTQPSDYPFLFREIAFVKTENGYRTEDGRNVERVDGWDNLDELMKRSISQEGKLLYYPVLLKDNDPSIRLDLPQSCKETLIVHYTNKTTQELKAEPFQIYSETFLKTPEEYQVVTSRQNGEIPVFQFNEFDLDYEEEISEGAKVLKKAPIAILDLRSNRGGSALIAEDWISKYANTLVLMNRNIIDTKTGEFLRNEEDKWIENPNMLIILSGKYSASASEMLIDCAYNLENVLIIGENTMGALLGGQGSTCLPSSAVKVGVGNGLMSLQTEGDHFEELRGFYPDIWVPAGEAEELAVKLIENLK